MNNCLLRSASRTQRTIALSSGEVEAYVAISGGCDSLLLKECLTFLFPFLLVAIKLFIDSSAFQRARLEPSRMLQKKHPRHRLLYLMNLWGVLTCIKPSVLKTSRTFYLPQDFLAPPANVFFKL